MPTAAVRKRFRRTKLKLKLSFGSTLHLGSTSPSTSSRGGPSRFDSNMKAKLPEIFALLKMQLKPDVPGTVTGAVASKNCSKDHILASSETTPSDKCEARSPSHSTDPLNRRECKASVSEVVDAVTSFIGEHEVIVKEEPEPKALTETDVVDIVRQLREVLQEKSPFQEDDLEALNTSQAQLILEVYGALAAFLDQRPGFRMVHEDPYSLVYYHGTGDKDACSCTSLLQDGASAGCGFSHSNYSGRQHADGEPRRARLSSSSSCAYESAVVGDDEEQEIRRMKYCWSQVPSPPSKSQALQAVQETCDAEGQTQNWDPARFTESTLRKHDVDVTELKWRPQTIWESHASELQQLRVKIDKLLRPTPPAPPLSAAELRNCTAKKERKPTSTKGAGVQFSLRPPQPRSPLR
ncbi:hypothetical protein HPB49_017569 [Dermacentor silvarum]|uniref:Uncharacterized protein n=1 Tax=Dermacentor silvarum TaxID=543639 RepID=A0ACB8D721_DERSI|nr:hypothetical protein HPB49_017569 [Dermacentor silvarum]